MKRGWIGMLGLILWIGSADVVWAQTPDSTATVSPLLNQETVTHTPTGALWRAAVLPGWGQWYNRQKYKIPFVYVAIGGVTALALYYRKEYRLYRNAYRFQIMADDPDGANQRAYDQLLARFGATELSADLLLRNRDQLRSRRDLLYVGIFAVYALTVLEAYVAAQLVDFDVSEDLSLHLTAPPTGPALALRFKF